MNLIQHFKIQKEFLKVLNLHILNGNLGKN